MNKILVVNPEKCIGCRTCELACSFVHLGVFNPVRSRISVFNFEKEGYSVPIVCQQCAKAACQGVCPVSAISIDPSTGAKIVNDKKCIGCKMCTIACPFGATFYDEESSSILKCDLCSGDPACVKFCPSGALEYKEANVATTGRKRAYVSKLRAFMEEEV